MPKKERLSAAEWRALAAELKAINQRLYRLAFRTTRIYLPAYASLARALNHIANARRKLHRRMCGQVSAYMDGRARDEVFYGDGWTAEPSGDGRNSDKPNFKEGSMTFLIGSASVMPGDDPRPVLSATFDPSRFCVVAAGPGAGDATGWPVVIRVRDGLPRAELEAYLEYALGELRLRPPSNCACGRCRD